MSQKASSIHKGSSSMSIQNRVKKKNGPQVQEKPGKPQDGHSIFLVVTGNHFDVDLSGIRRSRINKI